MYTIVGTGGSITLSTCNPATTFDTKLFVFSGTCGSYTCVGGNDDTSSCTANTTASSVTFSSTFGTTYYVLVGGYQAASGTFVLSTTCATPPAAPTITSLTPDNGPTGTLVTIAGTNFTGASRVTFNGTTSTYNVVNAQTITVPVPNAATTGNVIVYGTTGIPSNGVLFTVTTPPAPVITSLSPTSGPAGTVVTLTGTNFTGATSITLNGVVITGFTVVNGTTITFTVPAGATTGNVVVTTSGGASAGSLFTVTIVSATAKANQTEFSVWPNPVAGKGTMHVALTAATTKASATLRNVLGQVVATRTFSGSTTELPTTGLASGTYLLTVQMEGRAPSIQRVVVE
jgi:hypothetical protein